MGYIGQQLPVDVFSGFTIDKFTGDGTANKALTLSKAPFSETTVLVTIDGVVQEPTDDFTVSGTTLTLVGTAANGSEINVTHLSGTVPSTLASKVDLNGVSDTLILDADADTTISADTDDQIDFKVAGTDVVKITAATLDVTGPGNTGGIININNTDTEGASTDNIGRINFVGNDGSSSASGTRAAIETEVTGNFGSTQLNIEVAAGGAAAAKIATFSPTGLDLADGDLSVASGHGISFAATSDASGMSSELLDDYEEGTWTPAIANVTTSAVTGKYTKIGRHVSLHLYMAISGGTLNSTTIQITGVPFANGDHEATGSIMYNQIDHGADYQIMPYLNQGTSAIRIYQSKDATGWSTLATQNLSSSSSFFISLVYES